MRKTWERGGFTAYYHEWEVKAGQTALWGEGPCIDNRWCFELLESAIRGIWSYGVAWFGWLTLLEMQSTNNKPACPANPTISSTFRHIIRTSGVKELFRGVVPRIGVAAWATVCMVGFGDTVKELVNR